MADFCNLCTPFENDYDIDLFQEALNVENGHSINILCEGCNIKAIYKDEEGIIYLAKETEGNLELIPVNLEDLMSS